MSKTVALRGANGWQTSSQKYANNMGLNKKVEIIIDGTRLGKRKLYRR